MNTKRIARYVGMGLLALLLVALVPIVQTTRNIVLNGNALARWDWNSGTPVLNLGTTAIAWSSVADFSSTTTKVVGLADKADTYNFLTQPDGDLTGGHFMSPANGAADAVTTAGDNVMLCEVIHLPMWLTVANAYVRFVVASDTGSDETLAIAIYENADAGVQLTEGVGADSTTTENVVIDVTDVTLGPGMYRFCGCAQDISGGAFHAETRDDEYIDIMNQGAVKFGTAANACVAGNPPTLTGALTTRDDNAIVFKIGS